MKNNKLLGAIMFAAAFSLAGCSDMLLHDDEANSYANKQAANEPAESFGAGEPTSFGGVEVIDDEELSEQAQTAPQNQVYHFDFDSTFLHKGDAAALKAQADFLANHPGAKVLLAGHTDEVGSREYNVALGERRDHSVRDFLMLNGVKQNQIEEVSYGAEKPVDLHHSESAHLKNRRVQLTFKNLG